MSTASVGTSPGLDGDLRSTSSYSVSSSETVDSLNSPRSPSDLLDNRIVRIALIALAVVGIVFTLYLISQQMILHGGITWATITANPLVAISLLALSFIVQRLFGGFQ